MEGHPNTFTLIKVGEKLKEQILLVGDLGDALLH